MCVTRRAGAQDLHDPITRANLQVKFIDFILTPWWDKVRRSARSARRCLRLTARRPAQMSRVFPCMADRNAMLQRNREYYQSLASSTVASAQPAHKPVSTTVAAKPAFDRSKTSS